MPENIKHITARVPSPLIEQLDEVARKRRQKSGDIIRRNDMVREAIEALVKADSKPATSIEDEDFGVAALDVLEGLAQLANAKGIDDVQDMAMSLGTAAENDPRTERLRAFVSKLHGTLQSV